MNRVLVLGAGQIGTFAARALAEAGCTVVAADLHPAFEYFARFGPCSGGKLVVADIVDSAALCALIKAHEVDAIVLSAGVTSGATVRARWEAWKTDVDGAAVVAAAAVATQVKRLIFVSSFAVYGRPAADLLTEMTPLAPLSEYGRRKLAAELALVPFGQRGLDIRILRPCGIYGPLRLGSGSHSGRFIEAVLRHASQGRDLTIRVSPTTTDEYLYVKDLARAIALVTLCDADRPALVFNVGAGKKTTAQDLCLALQQVVPNVSLTVETVDTNVDTNDDRPMPPLDVSRIRQFCGFAPQYSLAAGLADYLQEARLQS